jgi:tetratricopeptide (TPR) repeat protein
MRARVGLFLSAYLLFAAIAFAATYSIGGANAYVARKDWNGLAAYCNGWTRANPQDPMAWYYLGNTYGIGLNRPASALPAFQTAAKLRPQWPEVWDALGHVYAQLGRYSESAAAYARAASQRPSRIQYWYNLASAYSDAKQWELARQALLNGRNNAGAAPWSDWYNLGNGFLALRQYSDAAFSYQHCLRLNPGYGSGWNNLGVALQNGGNADGALRAYREASRLGDPLGKQNLAGLENAMRQAQSRSTGRSGPNPAGAFAAMRDFQARSYVANHPEATYGQALGATSH